MASLLLNKRNNPRTYTTPTPVNRVTAASKDAGGREPTLEIRHGGNLIWGPEPISINAIKIPVGANGLTAGTAYVFQANFMKDGQSITISFV
jgi:hypothetical protein